ncbi:hypothetical protein Acsp04_58320 [Actinomadura sp. NBRC 104425]|uniref:hypothetical protein n=1 Tax=Actinomadura sp. NBRC 104425 TaxID=3032204 RepID=UPI0024A2D991|nr:hypothetical protein [Actinomadura sp. NBRC 104425]GLZ15597.1 hypothetical protein Acsp04_58320 [Actinomadura sp. NBRC 104425]
MQAVQLAELLAQSPPGVAEAVEVVAGFDAALAGGLARLGPRHTEAVNALAAAVGASPLGTALADASAKVAGGAIGVPEMTALAGARAALLGAAHDALLARLDGALGRSRAVWEERPAEGEPVPANLLAAARSWLRELAIAGWLGVDEGLASAAEQAVEALWGEPRLRRLAVLLDGMAAELRVSSPVATMDRVPERRWADLWTRAVLLSHSGGWTGGTATVSGRLLPLGVDVHEHGTAVQAQLHAVLEPADGDGPVRLVRVAVSAAKVDTIVGPEVWKLLSAYPTLLAALAEHRSVNVAGMRLTAGGDLLWDEERAEAGEPADPFATARVRLPDAEAPAVAPLDRHPVHIAEPVLVEGYKVKREGTFDLGGQILAVDLDRLPPGGPLTERLVTASTACIGLLRWDAGRWSLQPLAVQSAVKKQPVAAHNGDWALGPTDPKVVKAQVRSGDPVAVLTERAGRLLRK